MASSHHHHHHHHRQPPPSPANCCCNPSFTCCTTTTTTPPHHHQYDHLLQTISSLLISQPHLIPTQLHPINPNSLSPHDNLHYQKQHHLPQHHSTISSLLHRIESLESSLNHHTHQSLRHSAARIIQTHFRSFLVRRSRTLRHLKHLAFIKSSFNSLKLSFSNHTHFDFPALSLKATNLLLELDSIEDCDPMIVDGKRSISRDLVQFLDSIEEVALKKHLRCVKVAKIHRSGQKAQKARSSGDDEKRKLLQNLRARVDKISRLCKVSENEEDSEPEEAIQTNVLLGSRKEVSPDKNGVFVRRQGVQPRVKKSVRFAENGNVYEVYSNNSTSDLSGDGSSSGDEHGETLENVSCAVEDVVDSSQGAEDDEEALVMDSEGSQHSSDDGENNSRRDLKNGGRNAAKKQFQTHQEMLLFSAPLPVKMENRTDSKKSKGVKILT